MIILFTVLIIYLKENKNLCEEVAGIKIEESNDNIMETCENIILL